MVEQRAARHDQQRVVFPFDEGAEILWCDKLLSDKYRVDNIPLFAYGVSVGDVISTKRVDGDDRPYFNSLIERSGNKTCRVTVGEGMSGIADVLERLSELAKLASGIERYGRDYVAFNFPPSCDLDYIEARLNDGEDKGYWDWELSSALPSSHDADIGSGGTDTEKD
ncbi:MAG TPA: DUF4265 domain-containing protein [Candidatus Baltobacteraceae bacterium]|nr:DUF4265 domain-containing protein [Candidatus Baltobacteraceae bacterium]